MDFQHASSIPLQKSLKCPENVLNSLNTLQNSPKPSKISKFPQTKINKIHQIQVPQASSAPLACPECLGQVGEGHGIAADHAAGEGLPQRQLHEATVQPGLAATLCSAAAVVEGGQDVELFEDRGLE